jgi:hypothetical protein
MRKEIWLEVETEVHKGRHLNTLLSRVNSLRLSRNESTFKASQEKWQVKEVIHDHQALNSREDPFHIILVKKKLVEVGSCEI